MGNFTFRVPSLGNKFIDYRNPIAGDSYNWHWVRPMSQVKYIAIHHTAGPDTQTPDEIANYHVRSLNWGGVGYHFIITKSGIVYYVGDLTTARAHVYRYNHLALGICLVGTFMGNRVPSDKQLASAHELCAQLLFRTPELPGTDGWEDVVPHRQLRSTACPGETWNRWRPKIIKGIGEIGEVETPSQAKRAEEISGLYRIVLGREPDQSGLNHYVSSSLTIDQVRKVLTESDEHKQILNKANNFKQAQVLASESLTYVSQTHTKIEQITKLNQ